MNLNNCVGLYNMGNTCYMNSAIQILVNNNSLSKFFIENDFDDDNLIKFKKFVTQYKSASDSFPPTGVKDIVGEKHGMFGGFLQNDSHEFIVLLLDVLEEALKAEKKDNIIERLYDYKLSSTLKCKIKKCCYTSVNTSMNRFLTLEIPESSGDLDLDDCYRDYKSREKLEQEERWYCENCKKKRIASKRLNIEEWPRHLLIQLNRFIVRPPKIMKNNKTINVPIEWRHNYFLKGFVIHSGGPGGGHYISVAQVNNKWYLFDDTRKNEIDDKQVEKLASCAYLLYYENLT
jgi:ubiquitin C-terminal hydrolase